MVEKKEKDENVVKPVTAGTMSLAELDAGLKRIRMEVTLPSGATRTVLEMTASEESVMRQPDKLRTGRAIEELLLSCVEGAEPDELMNMSRGDRTALLVAIRRISYGDEYSFKLTCSQCRSVTDKEVKLSELQYTKADPNAPKKIKLPKSGWEVELRELNGADEHKMMNFIKKSPEDMMAYEIYLCLEKVSGNPRDVVGLDRVKKLVAADCRAIREAVGLFSPGVDTEIIGTCNTCKAEFAGNIPLSADFFFPGRA
jgi:hypothetical protein